MNRIKQNRIGYNKIKQNGIEQDRLNRTKTAITLYIYGSNKNTEIQKWENKLG